MSHLAWAVGKSCREPAPKRAQQGDYWTQHAQNFVEIREKEMRPATAEASVGQVHKVAVGINEEIKMAAFEGGNTTALKFIANYGRDLRRRTRQLLKPANMQVESVCRFVAESLATRVDLRHASSFSSKSQF